LIVWFSSFVHFSVLSNELNGAIEEAPENGKESSRSAHANGMYE
jgi:hypothetical protein